MSDSGRMGCRRQRLTEQKRCSVDQHLQYRGWDEEGNEVEATTFNDASKESVSRYGYMYECSVQTVQIGYALKVLD